LGSRNLNDLSLVIKSNQSISNVHSNSTITTKGSLPSLPKPVDLQHVDFIGPADAVKQLFKLSVGSNNVLLALHKIGGTLLIDSVPVRDDNNFFNENPQANTNSFDNSNKFNNSMFSDHFPFTELKNGQINVNQLKEKKLVEDFLEDLTPAISHSSSQTNTTTLLIADRVDVKEKNEEFIDIDVSKLMTSDVHNSVVSKHSFFTPSITLPLIAGSPFLPPPNYFIPDMPQPSRLFNYYYCNTNKYILL
jgi:hypothetical protein